jgi:hypothetical protein
MQRGAQLSMAGANTSAWPGARWLSAAGAVSAERGRAGIFISSAISRAWGGRSLLRSDPTEHKADSAPNRQDHRPSQLPKLSHICAGKQRRCEKREQCHPDHREEHGEQGRFSDSGHSAGFLAGRLRRHEFATRSCRFKKTPTAARIARDVPRTFGVAESLVILEKSRRGELNSRPTHYECVALPTELQRHKGLN